MLKRVTKLKSQGPTIEPLEGRLFLSAAPPVVGTADAPPRATSAHAAASGGHALGGNLNMQNDRIQDHAFVDLALDTRGFFNVAGRVNHSTGAAALAFTDVNGWPTEDFAFSADDQSEFGVQITPGVYHLSFTGPAGVLVATTSTAPGPRSGPAIATNKAAIGLTATGYSAATGVHTFDVNVPNGIYTLAFKFTNTVGKVKNIHVIQPGYNPASYPVYTTAYLNLLSYLSPNVMRFMDFTQTNNNTVVNWSDRTTPASPTIPAKGVSWEDCVLLANTLHKGMWINVPAQASDDYVHQLATLLKNTLSPGLPIYVEYSNEVWNYSFTQAHYNKGAAVAEVTAGAKAGKQSDLNYDHLSVTNSGNAETWAERRYARRGIQISNIFKSVWTSAGLANPINSRVRIVLGGQASNLSRFDIALKYVSAVYGAPKNFFYSLAIAPYFAMGKYADQYGVSGITANQVLQGFAASIANFQSSGAFSQAFAKANAYGLKLDAYEAGENTYGPLNIAAKRAAILDPRNATLIEQFLNSWYSAGGDQLNWYTLGARSDNTQYGSWSITDNITDYNEPKEQAYIAVRNGA